MKGNKFSSINAPTAGPRVERDLLDGPSSFQLYSLGNDKITYMALYWCNFGVISKGTPNGWKVGIMLEELGIEYDAHGATY